MQHLPNNPLSVTISALRSRRLSLLVIMSACSMFALLLSACSGNALSGTGTAPVVQASTSIATLSTTAANAAATTSNASTATTATNYAVKVFFSKYPDSVNTDSSAVYPVNRVSPTIEVGTFALQLLIAGPTLSEQKAGYFTEINTLLSGPSHCSAPLPVGGPDFTLTLNKKGSAPETGTATMQFCRVTGSPGIGTDARVTAEVNATLKQFASIKKVVILTMDGHCFADESGKDFCLQ